MRELILLRHAHAEPATTGQSDLDRPLSPQGLAEAEAVARWLKEQGLVPDRVLCSPARRTRETLEAVMDAIGYVEQRLEERIYEATPTVVYVGYTPGYLGTVVVPGGTVVYGTGYAYSAWVGTAWYPPPYTYGVAAAPVYNPYVGFSFGFAMGLATAAWTEPYWGGAYYHPAYWGAYPCCASARSRMVI